MIILKPSPLTTYLKKYEHIYPGIELWFQKRVEIDVSCGTKIIYRFDKNYEIEGLGIVDIIQGKLCHLSIEHAVRGSGIGRAILSLVKMECVNNGHDVLWCHGPENISNKFIEWAGFVPVKMLHRFGRNEIRDVKMVLPLLAEKRISK